MQKKPDDIKKLFNELLELQKWLDYEYGYICKDTKKQIQGEKEKKLKQCVNLHKLQTQGGENEQEKKFQ